MATNQGMKQRKHKQFHTNLIQANLQFYIVWPNKVPDFNRLMEKKDGMEFAIPVSTTAADCRLIPNQNSKRGIERQLQHATSSNQTQIQFISIFWKKKSKSRKRQKHMFSFFLLEPKLNWTIKTEKLRKEILFLVNFYLCRLFLFSFCADFDSFTWKNNGSSFFENGVKRQLGSFWFLWLWREGSDFSLWRKQNNVVFLCVLSGGKDPILYLFSNGELPVIMAAALF